MTGGLFNPRQVCLLFLILASPLTPAAVNVSVDRQQIAIDESFQIIFEAVQSTGEPDFRPLRRDFHVLSNSQSSTTTITNGNIESSRKWVLELMAKRKGKLIIPPVKFGDKMSQAFFIEVKNRQPSANNNAGEDVFFELSAVPKQVYVQQQILLTVNLFLAVRINNGSLSEPQLSGIDAVIQKMGDDKTYQTRRGGRAYTVYQRRYAIFPQGSGQMQIQSPVFKGRVVGGANTSILLNRPGRQILKRSNDITIDVQGVPDIYQGQHWLPAQDLQITESWSQAVAGELPVFRAGEPATRTLTLTAAGLTASQLPELPARMTADFKQYPDQPVLSDKIKQQGITGTRVEKVAVIPGVAGEHQLPEVLISWWDTKNNKQQYASLPERTVKVLPPLQSAGTTVPADASGLNGLQSPVDQGPGRTPLVTQSGTGGDPQDLFIWKGMAVFFALLWLLTLYRVIQPYYKNIRAERFSSANAKASTSSAVKSLKYACQRNDLRLTKEALLNWDKCLHPDNPVGSLAMISRRYQCALREHIQTVSDLLYGKEQNRDWQGLPLWNAVSAYHQRRPSRPAEKESALQPLHRL